MPFGLKNAPAHFQKTVVAVIEVAPGVHVVVYLDDIVVHGSTPQEVWELTLTVIRRLTEAGFMINLRKSHFVTTSAVILGHEVREGYIRPNPKKTIALFGLKPPRTFK